CAVFRPRALHRLSRRKARALHGAALCADHVGAAEDADGEDSEGAAAAGRNHARHVGPAGGRHRFAGRPTRRQGEGMPGTVVTLYIDYKSPYAFVAKAGAYALEEDYDVSLRWLPYTLNIPSYLGSVED